MASRWSNIAAGLAALAGLAGASALWLVRRPLAQTKGTLRLPGLEDDVEVFRDAWGVPHIYAKNLHDLVYAQGFVHAQDRLWQMDFQRRLVAGRLSEILGETTLPVDRWLRILGMRRVAERDVELLDEETRAVVEAYAAGVNARLDRGRRPLECTLLRYRPEPWTAVDTVSWAKFMSWSLSVNWEAELLRAQLIALLGPERAAELEPEPFDDRPAVVPPGVKLAGLGTGALQRAEDARPIVGPAARDGLGSNSWAVSGARTANGAALFANDTHLPMSLPCVWYENHLVAGDLNLSGGTFPGIPLLVFGHNGHVAWGQTNGFADVQDLYVERLRRREQGQVQYLFRDEWLDAELVREEIKVRNAAPVVEEVIITHHGPIINALAPELAGEVRIATDTDDSGQPPESTEADQPLALRWTSLDPETTINALLPMNRARDCLELREALRFWAAPQQNIVYADSKGNIGYTFAGQIPIRAKGDGRLPVPGWTGEYEWTGHIPFDELPHCYNPPQGYIATANNRPVAGDYPHFLMSDCSMGDRAQRIVELLEARPTADAGFFKTMHFDQVSPLARDINHHLGRLPVDDPELASIVERMRVWDGTLGAGSPEAAIYEVFVRRMIRTCLTDRLGELMERYAGQGPTPLIQEGTTFAEKSWAWLRETLAEPDSPRFDLGGGEDRDEIMRRALAGTVNFLKDRFGPDVETWNWGSLHLLAYVHALGRVRPLDRLLNRGPFPMGGDQSTVWATGHRSFGDTPSSVIGPPFRFIADLGDPSNSWGLLAPGQSGQPGSKHYDDQIQAWFDGSYHPMLYHRDDVEREARAHLRLRP